MAFENCTGRFKLVFLKNFVELYKVLSRTASVNVIAFSVLKILQNLVSMQKCLLANNC